MAAVFDGTPSSLVFGTKEVTMRLDPDSPLRMNEQRRYLPDWTRRVLEVHEELEADHNSYLAGGYAEEFGYWAQPGASRGVPLLDGESPEEYAEWLAQSAIHPGYPLRPYPIALDREHPRHGFPASARRSRIEASSEAVHASARKIAYRGTYVRVTDRRYERERHGAAQRTAAVLTRVLAALVALRWELPRRH
jgi:hypothetical protein